MGLVPKGTFSRCTRTWLVIAIKMWARYRHIFFSDAPHLLKTGRNFLYSSGSALYNSSTDPRFDWLQGVVLQFLVDWRESIDSREGDFNETARSKMFISWQKFEGFQVTVYSAIDAVKFLLAEGVEFVLSERFCQDPLEEYFGNQRKFGRCSDNPDLQNFGCNDNTIRIQKSITCESGNNRG